MRSIVAAALLQIAFAATVMPANAEAKRPPTGRYTCLYPPFSTPHPLKLVTHTKYKIDKAKKSRYSYSGKSDTLDFRKGPYSDYYARYERENKQIVIYDKETDFRFWNCPKGKL